MRRAGSGLTGTRSAYAACMHARRRRRRLPACRRPERRHGHGHPLRRARSTAHGRRPRGVLRLRGLQQQPPGRRTGAGRRPKAGADGGLQLLHDTGQLAVRQWVAVPGPVGHVFQHLWVDGGRWQQLCHGTLQELLHGLRALLRRHEREAVLVDGRAGRVRGNAVGAGGLVDAADVPGEVRGAVEGEARPRHLQLDAAEARAGIARAEEDPHAPVGLRAARPVPHPLEDVHLQCSALRGLEGPALALVEVRGAAGRAHGRGRAAEEEQRAAAGPHADLGGQDLLALQRGEVEGDPEARGVVRRAPPGAALPDEDRAAGAEGLVLRGAGAAEVHGAPGHLEVGGHQVVVAALAQKVPGAHGIRAGALQGGGRVGDVAGLADAGPEPRAVEAALVRLGVAEARLVAIEAGREVRAHVRGHETVLRGALDAKGLGQQLQAPHVGRLQPPAAPEGQPELPLL
mmetsp:Transcript_106816/g.344684  ORF Transcript_106816/g.344684 Transcript_106816/m.344684 type:complete len:458 (+) Transcript_106816:323-1696(+)